MIKRLSIFRINIKGQPYIYFYNSAFWIWRLGLAHLKNIKLVFVLFERCINIQGTPLHIFLHFGLLDLALRLSGPQRCKACFCFVSVLPLNVSILEPVEPFSLSRPATVECRSVGSRPPAIVTWWKRGKFMGKPTEEVRTCLD